MAEKRYIVEVEAGVPAAEGKPSKGPVYRSIYAKDGFPVPPEGMETCWDIFRMSVDKYPANPMLGERHIVNGKAGEYVWRSYKDVYDIVIKLGNSLRSCDIGWALWHLWSKLLRVDHEHGGAGAVEFIILHAEVSLAFVEEKKIAELLKTLPKAAECLKTIVSFGNVTPEQKDEVCKYGITLYAWEEFLKLGDEKEYELPEKCKTDICTIMYTSGTTGDPKGVLITNENIITLIAGVKVFLESVNEKLTVNDVYISYLPLAHIFDRVIEECFISHGAQIGFWRGDVKLLIEDLGELKPTVFCAVPRVLDRIYTGLQDKLKAGGTLKNAIFNVAYNYKFGNMKKGSKHEEASPLSDKIVFNKVKQGLGGRVRLILSGAAPLASHVETFLRVVACCYVLQGYGLTETCAGTFVSLPNELQMLGTVGPPVPNVDVRLESIPEMEYDALGAVSRGEICVRGKTVFAGYHKREDLTKEVLVDGWFHTGDVGEWQPDGSLKIIDRKKNIFKLSQGEYVAVENLENIFRLCSAVDSIWVYGNSFQSFLVAVANPSKKALEQWANENGINEDFKSLCENPKAREYLTQELTKIGREKKLKGFELIKAVHLDPEPFDIERDLLTPTYKLKRPQMLKYYAKVIDEMYEAANKPKA
ncbi:hypothetical protein V2J09_014613 [Rumex salicifolius]